MKQPMEKYCLNNNVKALEQHRQMHQKSHRDVALLFEKILNKNKVKEKQNSKKLKLLQSKTVMK